MLISRKLFKTAKKIEELVNFSTDYKRSNISRNYKHNSKNKLTNLEHIRYNCDSIYYGGQVLLINYFNINENVFYTENNDKIEIRKYDNDELFNLSTLYSNELIDKLIIHTLIKSNAKFQIITMNYEIICDASNAINTQYRKYNNKTFWDYYVE